MLRERPLWRKPSEAPPAARYGGMRIPTNLVGFLAISARCPQVLHMAWLSLGA